MVDFAKLWTNHVGREFLCDDVAFANQCAMRLGHSLEKSGINLAPYGLKRCTSYAPKFREHKPGHIRSAQELANVLYKHPRLLGPGIRCQVMTGSIDDNVDKFVGNSGVVFIMNGWGTTDHIDLWNGKSELLRGSRDTASYRKAGKQVWFWKLAEPAIA